MQSPAHRRVLVAQALQHRRQILAQVGEGGREPAPGLFEDAAWVGWRLAELLPLSLPQRQALLQFDDPHLRLQRLLDHIGETG